MRVKTIWMLLPLLSMAGGAQAVSLNPLVQVEGSSYSPRILNSIRTADGEIIPEEEWFSYIRPRVYGGFEGYLEIAVFDRDGNLVEDTTGIVSYPEGGEFGSLGSLFFYLYDDSYSGYFSFDNALGAVYYAYDNISMTDVIGSFTAGAGANLAWTVDYPGFEGSIQAGRYIAAGGSASGCGAGASVQLDAQIFNGSSGNDSVNHAQTFDVLFAPGDFCEFELYEGQRMSAEWSAIDAPVPVPLPSPILMLVSALGLAAGGSFHLRRKEI